MDEEKVRAGGKEEERRGEERRGEERETNPSSRLDRLQPEPRGGVGLLRRSTVREKARYCSRSAQGPRAGRKKTKKGERKKTRRTRWLTPSSMHLLRARAFLRPVMTITTSRASRTVATPTCEEKEPEKKGRWSATSATEEIGEQSELRERTVRAILGTFSTSFSKNRD